MPNLSVLDVRLYDQSIGTLTRLPGDRVLFAFTDDYMANGDRPTLSLSFKDAFGSLLSDTRSTQTRLPVFFSNLLPEGAMRDYLATRAGTTPEREFFLMSVLGRDLPRGLDAVGERAFTIKRFDRKADGQRVHIEDFAQVFGVYPERKYERASYRDIASVIWTEAGETGIAEFVRRFRCGLEFWKA